MPIAQYLHQRHVLDVFVSEQPLVEFLKDKYVNFDQLFLTAQMAQNSNLDYYYLLRK